MEQQPPPQEVPPHNHIGKLNPLEQSIVDYTGYILVDDIKPPLIFHRVELFFYFQFLV